MKKTLSLISLLYVSFSGLYCHALTTYTPSTVPPVPAGGLNYNQAPSTYPLNTAITLSLKTEPVSGVILPNTALTTMLDEVSKILNGTYKVNTSTTQGQYAQINIGFITQSLLASNSDFTAAYNRARQDLDAVKASWRSIYNVTDLSWISPTEIAFWSSGGHVEKVYNFNRSYADLLEKNRARLDLCNNMYNSWSAYKL